MQWAAALPDGLDTMVGSGHLALSRVKVGKL